MDVREEQGGGAQAEAVARPAPLRGRLSGTGSWPVEHPLEAARTVLDELGTAPGLPFVVEQPGRGPGAEPVGRTASVLVDLPVDLQPSGWRFVDHAGRDAERARSLRRSDLDALAEAADGYAGELKVQLAGPWTLAASVRLLRGERASTDPGARRDVVDSLAEGLGEHLAEVRRAVPGAELALQVDEPSLPAVLDGTLRRASGFGRVEPVPADEVEVGLRTVVEAGRRAGARHVLVRCGEAGAPLDLLGRTGADGVGVDLAGLDDAAWEALAPLLEDGRTLWAGLRPDGPDGALRRPADLVEDVRRPWARLGLPPAALAGVALTPAGGLAGATPARARAVLRRLREAADALLDVSAG
ncbi:methionine synthase [Pseudokineococcus sp. 1T1Z-3]|uniref:methionine synthase n=1 Tax=Pseudokineococcus sp. 1T1Z-3 TaxID=3132745 RepID=UPI0030A041C2